MSDSADTDGRLTREKQQQLQDTDAHLRDLTPQQRKYVEAIVHLGASQKHAAQWAGMTEDWCFRLRHNPRVNRAIEVEQIVHFRGVRREIVKHLKEIMSNGENEVARVNAARVLDSIVKPVETEAARSVQQPGYVLLIPGAAPPQTTIEHEPFQAFPPVQPRKETGYAQAAAARWAFKRKLAPPPPDVTERRKSALSEVGQRPEVREIRRITARRMWAKRKAAAAAAKASTDGQSSDQDG